MKKLSFIFLLIAQKVFSQQEIVNYQSFIIDHKEVAWVQVYHFDDTVNNFSGVVFEHLKRKVWIKDIHYDGADIVADVVNYRPDYKRYGGKYLNTSMIVRTGKWSGKVRLNFKAGKYRVILYGLHFDAKQSRSGSGKATIENRDISGTLSEWSLNNYRSGFRKGRLTTLDILHLSFKDSFTMKLDQLIDSDW